MNLLVSLFNNPIGRWYLGVPKGKQLFRITKKSAHFYTGEFTNDGLPIISTGETFAGGMPVLERFLFAGKVLGIVSLLPFVRFIHLIGMAPLFALTDTAETFAGTAANNSTVGVKDWTAVDNMKVNDGTVSTCTFTPGDTTEVTHYAFLTNFGFSLPGGATVGGVTVNIKRRDDFNNDNVSDNSLKLLKATTLVGSDKANTITTWPAVLAVAIYGGSSDLWGTTLSQSDVNGSGFGVAFSAKNVFNDANRNVKPAVDYISIIITYTTNVAYTLALAQGSFTLTGEATLLNAGWKIIAAQGSYVLTGIDAAFHKGKTLIVAVGTYALTGIDTSFKKVISIPLVQGSYVLTGEAASLVKGLVMRIATGTYSLTGQILRMLYNGVATPWSNRTKPTTTFTGRTKPVTTFTPRTKPTSNWTKRQQP